MFQKPSAMCLGSYAVVAALALGGLAACGGSDDTSTAAGDTSSAQGTTGESTAGIAEAKRIADTATATAVVGPGAGALTPDQIVEATPDNIKATPYKPDGKPKKGVAIACSSSAPTCMRQAELQVRMFKALGWDATKITAGNDFSPASFVRAMTQAVAMKPDAIITNGIPGAAVGPQLAAAKDAGIFTVATNMNEASGPGYDAYNGGGFSLGTATLASEMITMFGDDAKVFWMVMPQFPNIYTREGIEFGKKQCPTCSFKSQDIQPEKVLDPVAYGPTMTAAIQANPGLDVVALPGDTPLEAGQQAINQSPNPDIAQMTVTFTAASAQALREGATPTLTGTPAAWSSVASVDQVVRNEMGEPALPEDELQIGTMVLKPDEIPEGKITEAQVDDLSIKRFDYLEPYSKAWGVDLSGIL